MSDLEGQGLSTTPLHTHCRSLLIAAESQMECQLLKTMFARARLRFSIYCASSCADVSRSMNTHHADIALVSDSLEDGPLTGFRVLNELQTAFPKTHVILLLKSDRQDLIVDAFRAGAKGVFCRTEPIEALHKCVSAVSEGQTWANARQMQYVLDAFANVAPLRLVNTQRKITLTKREKSVVRFVVEGYTNREAAQELGLSEHTVSNYLFRIYEKFGISSRVELVLYERSFLPG